MHRTIVLLFTLTLLSAPIPAAAATAPPAPDRTRRVAVVVYPGVEVLDFTGPTEVFTDAASFGRVTDRPAFEVFLVSRSHAEITAQGVMRVVPTYGIEDCPQPDILVLPGGSSGTVIADSVWMAWVQRTAIGAEHVLTVCTGAMIAGHCGLLDGLDVTTWYGAVDRLAEAVPKARAIPGRRFVDNGKVITTAGVSAGIDGSLHLVARLCGRYVADRTAEYMEYKWTPESYLSTRYPTLDPRLDARGRDLQRCAIQLHEGDAEGAAEGYRQWTRRAPTDAEAWLGLGHALHVLGRYPEAIRAGLEANRGPVQRPQASYNLGCSYARLGRHEEAISALRRAVESGFREWWRFERDPDLLALREDPRFTEILAGIPR